MLPLAIAKMISYGSARIGRKPKPKEAKHLSITDEDGLTRHRKRGIGLEKPLYFLKGSVCCLCA